MGYVVVKFLGEKYQVSESVNEFLQYDSLLIPTMEKLIGQISENLSRDSKHTPLDSFEYISGDLEKYKKIMIDGADLLLKKMFSLGIYDVTINDLIGNIDVFSDLEQFELTIKRKMVSESERFLNMRNRGMENAYRYARSNITGSGIDIFTNSISSLVAYSLAEGSILLSQAKKADKKYREAVSLISARVNSGLEQMCREVIFDEYYPGLIDILINFHMQITGCFLEELTSHNKFDFDSIEKYNMKKADDILNNIDQVLDKKEFLKQTFLICPFAYNLYEKCLEFGLLDKETFETAKYFGFADKLTEKIEQDIKKDLKNTEKIAPFISMLASHRETDEIEIWKKIYEGTLESIKNTYEIFNAALSDKRKLDRFVRDNINSSMREVIKKSREDVIKGIDKKMLSLVSEKQYDEFVGMGILFPEVIRMPGSSATVLNDINNEIKGVLTDCVMEYIEEARKRYDTYNKAMDIYEKELKQKNDELNALRSEKNSLGLFAFSKKKEMLTTIESKLNEISEFKRIHEPKELLVEFEVMYKF